MRPRELLRTGDGSEAESVDELALDLVHVDEVVDDHDLTGHLAELVLQLGGGEDEVGRLGGTARGTDISRLDIGVGVEALECFVGIHLEDDRRTYPHSADCDDLHVLLNSPWWSPARIR